MEILPVPVEFSKMKRSWLGAFRQTAPSLAVRTQSMSKASPSAGL